MQPTIWTSLAVPVRDFLELQELVAERQRGRGQPEVPGDSEIDPGAGVKVNALQRHLPWSEADLSRLLSDTTATAKRWVSVMDFCAQHPEEFFSTEQVSERVPIAIAEWRDACRKLRPLLEKRFADLPRWVEGRNAGQPVWPLAAVSGSQLGVRDQLYVAITAEQAERWNHIRSRESG